MEWMGGCALGADQDSMGGKGRKPRWRFEPDCSAIPARRDHALVRAYHPSDRRVVSFLPEASEHQDDTGRCGGTDERSLDAQAAAGIIGPVHGGIVATKRKRRILIAAVAVVGVLFVWSLSGRARGSLFLDFLQDHPCMAGAVRTAFLVVGRDREFDDWFGTVRGSEGPPLQLFEPDAP